MANFTIKEKWRNNANQILASHPNKEKIIKTLFVVLGQIERNDWRGACNATCSVIHVLLSEQGVQSKLVLGEARKGSAFFNHSWIEIENAIYDLAIAHPLIDEFSTPPTIKGYNVETLLPTEIEYDVDSGLADDAPTLLVKSMSLSAYFDNFPGHSTLGLWIAVLDAANQLGLKLDLTMLQSKYSNTQWS